MRSNYVSLLLLKSQQNAMYKPTWNKENHPAEFFLINHFWKISHYSTTNSQQQHSEESSVFL